MMAPKDKLDRLCALEDKVIERIEKVIDEPMETEMIVDIMECVSLMKKSHLKIMDHAGDGVKKTI